MARKPFTDRAGYTRHCWECKHAKNWRKGLTFGGKIDPYIADCELTDWGVGKYESPDNPCCHMPPSCNYERRLASNDR